MSICSNTTDDIDCWFIDTNGSEESFVVRHDYFLGKDESYEKAIKAEIDEAAWPSRYFPTSRPFDTPAIGHIAIKVIIYYGAQVLKVYEVNH